MFSKFLEIALSQIGVKELKGNVNDNKEILKYFYSLGHTWVKHDETGWCAAFINWILFKCGLGYSTRLTAKSYIALFDTVSTPRLDDLVILDRKPYGTWRGHIGIFINSIGYYVFILGGNQSNSVCIAPYPLSEVICYKRINFRDYGF